MHHEIAFDRHTPLAQTPNVGHNRWHPEIPPVLRVASGDTVVMDVRDGIDGQIRPGSTVEALLSLDPRRNLPMTGPIYVEDAEPGDLLSVELLEFEHDRYAWSGTFPDYATLKNRFEPYLIHWEVEDGVARSESLPGVAVRGRSYLGLAGVCPSARQLQEFTARERTLDASMTRPLKLPTPAGAVPDLPKVASEGLMPGPPRENGGNMDLRHTAVGSRLLLPVAVPGALFSVGDPHFNQGDGESLSSAIEMTCRAHVRLSVVKAGELEWSPTFPSLTFDAAKLDERGEYFATTGIPVDFSGANHNLDLTVATERALDEMVRYLTEARGFTAEQAAILVGTTVDIRCSEIVNYPNAVISAVLPLEIFEQAAA
jgi:formamidase